MGRRWWARHSSYVLSWRLTALKRVLMLAAALAAAVSLHYHSIQVWLAFIVAELSVWLSTRRLRPGVRTALSAGAAPLFFFANLLLKLRQYYGQNFWARPGVSQVFSVSRWSEAWGYPRVQGPW